MKLLGDDGPISRVPMFRNPRSNASVHYLPGLDLVKLASIPLAGLGRAASWPLRRSEGPCFGRQQMGRQSTVEYVFDRISRGTLLGDGHTLSSVVLARHRTSSSQEQCSFRTE
jgi:hypothetical protein